MEDNLDKLVNDALGDITINSIKRQRELLDDVWATMNVASILTKTGQAIQEMPTKECNKTVHELLEKIYEVMTEWKNWQD